MPDLSSISDLLAGLPKQVNDATTVYGQNVGIPLLGTGLGALASHLMHPTDDKLVEMLAASADKNDPISRAQAGLAIKRELPGFSKLQRVPGMSDHQAFSNVDDKAILLSPSSKVRGSALLHEAGHLKADEPRAMRTMSALGHKLSPYQLMTAAALFGNELGKDKEDRNMLLASLVGGSGVAMRLPTVLSELKASNIARQMAKTHGLPKPKGLNRALASYIASPGLLLGSALAGGAAYGINKLSS
jgi:hypothetical protein